VKQKDGTLVYAGLASGIWSCQADGSDIRWHALSCADNPTEIDFTPEGEIVGTVNLFYGSPRGDTIIHWLRGGVYPREDQLEAIAGLPRTLDVMPVVHNFGHVAVAGCAFYRSGALDPDWRGNLFVVHFNTQRVTRMELAPEGASYRATEREFLKLQNPNAHLTDVLEDRDGSVLIADTENHVIRRYTPRDGRIARVAGCGRKGAGGVPGPALEAELNQPHGVTIGPGGLVYIVDSSNHRILRVEK
jgi:hypothetical protein